jgi:phage tail sheath gpL-like
MSLTGVSPTRRTPGDLREFVFAAGPGSSGTTRDVLIYCNKTSAGSETVSVISTPILDRADAMARLGRRSEGFAMWKLFNAANKDANVYVAVATEGSTAVTRTVTFGSAETDVTTAQTNCKIEFQGESVEFACALAATTAQMAALFVTAFNNANGGEWQATAAAGTTPNLHVVTITMAQLGARCHPLLNNSLRVAFAATNGITITLGSTSSAGTDDDFTNVYAAAAAGEYYYQINPKFLTTAPTSTDNGVGEGMAYIRDQNSPSNGKAQVMHFGLTGTQAQSTTVATDADANSTLCRFWHQENSQWSAGMIAAHWCGLTRTAEIAHPSANMTGLRNSDAQAVLGPPDPLVQADRPTASEIELDLSNGVSPLAYTSRGDVYLPRAVTSYSEVAAGVKDYRASEGHIPSAIHFTWEVVKARWQAQKQPFLADDPVAGAKPLMKTSTPSALKALINSVIDDLTASQPLGLYEGPILSPSPADVQAMRDSIIVTHSPGKLSAFVDFKAVEHLLSSETKIREVSAAY